MDAGRFGLQLPSLVLYFPYKMAKFAQPQKTIPMPNVASVLKGEMSRLARREVRAETVALKKGVSVYRSEIAALKRRTQVVEQLIRRLSKPSPTVQPDVDASKLRFSAKGLAAQRRRLGLSAEQCGRLLGASSQSVYNWEQGKTRPLARHVPAIAALRGMSKKDVAARLLSMQR